MGFTPVGNRWELTGVSKDNLDNRFIADLTLQMLSYVAEKEQRNMKARQTQGIAVMLGVLFCIRAKEKS